MSTYPVMLHTAIDARNCRKLAEFYRQLLGLHYRKGEEPPADGSPDEEDWLVLLDDNGNRVVTIQEKRNTTPPTWPSEEVPMQMHMDFKVPTVEALETHRGRAEELGARLLYDRSQNEGEPLYVLADPAGHHSACSSSSSHTTRALMFPPPVLAGVASAVFGNALNRSDVLTASGTRGVDHPRPAKWQAHAR